MFYVSQIRDGRYRRVAGPFITKEEAELEVKPVRDSVTRCDPWSEFDSFGVCKISEQENN